MAHKCKDPIPPFRSMSAYWTGKRISFTANLGWWRWTEVGFTLKLDHDRSLLKSVHSAHAHHEVLWWRFLWLNGHFSLDWKRTGPPPQRVGWLFRMWGHNMKSKDLTRPI